MLIITSICYQWKKYYAGNVINVLDCVDEVNAEIEKFENGLVMEYTKYAFKRNIIEGQDIFKIVYHDTKRVMSTEVFVSDLFRETVLESGLKGFDFVEVWDSEREIVEPILPIPDFSSKPSYTFEEAMIMVEQEKVTIASDKWAIRHDQDGAVELGQLQEDGSYIWLQPIYYPPILLTMNWYVLESTN